MPDYPKNAAKMLPILYRTLKKAFVARLFLIWRRNRDLNPGTVLPIYELSKPAPSTTWVFLHLFELLVYNSIFSEKEKVFLIFIFRRDFPAETKIRFCCTHAFCRNCHSVFCHNDSRALHKKIFVPCINAERPEPLTLIIASIKIYGVDPRYALPL